MPKRLEAPATITAAIAVLAVVAGPAAAEDVTSSPTAERNIAIAAAYWGSEIPGYAVEVEPLPDGDVGLSPQPGTVQAIDPSLWNSGKRRFLCAVETHEYGHSLGFGHSNDPSNVMYPPPSEDAVPGCNAAYPTYEQEIIDADQPVMEAEFAAEPSAAPPRAAPRHHRRACHRHHRCRRHKARR